MPERWRSSQRCTRRRWSMPSSAPTAAGYGRDRERDAAVLGYPQLEGERPIKLDRQITLGGVAWSPDLRTVALVGDDGVVSLVDTRSGREIQRINRDGAGYLYAAFSRDGTRVATTMNFGGFEVPIWDVRSGSQVGSPGHRRCQLRHCLQSRWQPYSHHRQHRQRRCLGRRHRTSPADTGRAHRLRLVGGLQRRRATDRNRRKRRHGADLERRRRTTG